MAMPGPKRIGTPAQPDHLVIGRPVQEGVVGGVEHYQPAAALDILFECPLDRLGPAHAILQMSAIEVVDHHVVARELRTPAIPRLGRRIFGWSRRHVDGESALRDQDRAHQPGPRLPVMVIHAVDDQHPDRGRGRARDCAQ